MSFISEFKKFALRGNVVDLAIGVIIGGAFGKIVSSLVTDVIMPPIGVLLGGVDFAHLKLNVKAATEVNPAVTINYGLFLNTVIEFTIIAMVIFIVIKMINKMRGIDDSVNEPEPAPVVPTKEEILLTEIRDILKKQK